MLRALLPIILLLLAALLFGSAYTIHEKEQVIITQFGKPVSDPITDAGLHFRLPFIQKVRTFDKRILEWDGEVTEIVTGDKKTIIVDTTARWRIEDPLQFLVSVRDERRAQSRLDDILDSATKSAIAKNDLIEAVRDSNREFSPEDGVQFDTAIEEDLTIEVGREQLIQGILEDARQAASQLGIHIEDLRIRRLDYSGTVRRKIFDAMIAERNQIADKFRSEGRGRQAEIEGQREKELKRIESEAVREAEVIRGEADAEATRIYAEAYNADPEFYTFYQTLETWKKALAAGDTRLVLTTKSELLKFLKSPTD